MLFRLAFLMHGATYEAEIELSNYDCELQVRKVSGLTPSI